MTLYQSHKMEREFTVPPERYVEHIRMLHRATEVLHDGADDLNTRRVREIIEHYERIIQLLLQID